MKVASTKLTNSEWEALQNRCNEYGVTIAEYLRALVHNNASEGVGPNSSEQTQPPTVTELNQSMKKRKATKIPKGLTGLLG